MWKKLPRKRFGTISYGMQKLEYDAKHYDRIPSEASTAETQKKLYNTFLQVSRAEYENGFKTENKNDTKTWLLYTINRFIDLLDKTNSNECERALRCVLGKSRIADNTLVELLENMTIAEESKQIKQIIDCLEYISTGALENNESRGDFNSSIYPVTGKYRGNSESSDQCRIAVFSVRIDVDANGTYDYVKNINILSEFTYQINEYYYCLPNVIRSNLDWWIDPLIIKACDFDSIFQ